MSKHIVIVGAGPGGLACGMQLAAAGMKVSIYEKQPYVGGRNASLTIGDYTFDLGPTFLSMPSIVKELFQAADKRMEDYLWLIELDPLYRLVFQDESIVMYRDKQKMKAAMQAFSPRDVNGYEEFMNAVRKKWYALLPVLQNKHDSFLDYGRFRFLKALPHLSIGKSVHDVLSDYFHDERVKTAFSFQSKYLGMSPWECPGAFSILSFMEHEFGIFHPVGGVNQLSKAMATVIEDLGGHIYTGCGVQTVKTENGVAKGVVLEDGTFIGADDVVINADFGHAMESLFEPGVVKKYTPKALEKKKWSCSTFMIYLGLDKLFPSEHHTILFAKDYKKNVEEITKTYVLSEEPSIYIQNPSVTDSTLAPDGHSAMYILAPVPNNISDIDWENEAPRYRDLVLDELEKQEAFTGIREHIVVEKVLSPLDWEQKHYVYKGATFNLGHQLSQMMFFRPHNRFEEVQHVWLTGGGTHPGSGLPTILESARITAKAIRSQYKKEMVGAS
ncbi:phytoene desaturase family protein [Aureibacillus halotolerans]|uniref:Phytoene desaturase n=1 Tax=Aureibacillus halotolerans TaxID=1508390 RepID=A0A4R6UG17_9BACI|nr:phytoene desaturase family protein [Aureibacillus halotolerans]TDQ42084.1 phytoene desaturase [Aureibacillus halotolerans]